MDKLCNAITVFNILIYLNYTDSYFWHTAAYFSTQTECIDIVCCFVFFRLTLAPLTEVYILRFLFQRGSAALTHIFTDHVFTLWTYRYTSNIVKSSQHKKKSGDSWKVLDRLCTDAAMDLHKESYGSFKSDRLLSIQAGKIHPLNLNLGTGRIWAQ